MIVKSKLFIFVLRLDLKEFLLVCFFNFCLWLWIFIVSWFGNCLNWLLINLLIVWELLFVFDVFNKVFNWFGNFLFFNVLFNLVLFFSKVVSWFFNWVCFFWIWFLNLLLFRWVFNCVLVWFVCCSMCWINLVLFKWVLFKCKGNSSRYINVNKLVSKSV